MSHVDLGYVVYLEPTRFRAPTPIASVKPAPTAATPPSSVRADTGSYPIRRPGTQWFPSATRLHTGVPLAHEPVSCPPTVVGRSSRRE